MIVVVVVLSCVTFFWLLCLYFYFIIFQFQSMHMATANSQCKGYDVPFLSNLLVDKG